MPASKNYRSPPIPPIPPDGRGNVTATKDDGGVGEKFIAAGPIPPCRSLPPCSLPSEMGSLPGAVIAATTGAGFDESSFSIGAVSGTILLIAMALSGLLLLGSPAWTNVAGRIVGAWLVAIAGLLLALPAHQSNSRSSSRASPSLPSPPTAFRSVVPPWRRVIGLLCSMSLEGRPR